MLNWIVPRDVVRRREDEIYEVMGELAGIVEEEDGSSWSYSRKTCIEKACVYFQVLSLAHPSLSFKLKRLGDTWDSPTCY